jgi:hypothetical protein
LRPGGGCRSGEVVEVSEQAEAGANLLALGQMRPSVLMDITGGEPVRDVARCDALQDSLGRGELGFGASAINAPRVALEIVGERECLEQRRMGNRAACAVGKMVD